VLTDASVSETAHLQQRLRGLSGSGNNGNSNGPIHPTDLTTLRGRLVGQPQPVGSTGTTSTGSAASAAAACNGDRDSSIDEVSSSGPTSAAAAPLASSAHSSGSAAAAALTGASANPSSGNLAHSKADHTATGSHFSRNGLPPPLSASPEFSSVPLFHLYSSGNDNHRNKNSRPPTGNLLAAPSGCGPRCYLI
jgi:hypothetical protein